MMEVARALSKYLFFILLIVALVASARYTSSVLLMGVLFCAVLLFVYVFVNPLVLPANRKKLVGKASRFIDSLAVSGTEDIKGRLRQESVRWIFSQRATNEFAAFVERILIEAIGLVTIQRHLPELRRKKAQNTYTGDYGVYRNEAWLDECDYFVRAVLLPLKCELPKFIAKFSRRFAFLTENNPAAVEQWVRFLDSVVDAGGLPAPSTDLGVMSGHDYEAFIGDLAESFGWDVQVTKGSGDQGADVIAERGGMRVVMQCKLYASTIGNKAVQEVYAAKAFYDCDHAVVVSNSTYTPSARKIAERTGVQLIHHDQLGEYLEELA